MDKTIRLLVAATAAITLTACSKDDATIKTTSTGETNRSPSADSASARGTALVRFVNAADGMRLASLRSDDAMLFDSVKAASVTDFREMDKSMAHFTARAVGRSDTTALAGDNKMLVGGNRYSVILMSEDMAKQVLRVVQDEIIPDSGKARVRIIHAASGGPAVDIRAVNATDDLFADVAFKNEAGYKDIAPATIALEVRDRRTGKTLLTLPAMTLDAGTATTVVITGSTKLSFFTFTDTMMPSMASR